MHIPLATESCSQAHNILKREALIPFLHSYDPQTSVLAQNKNQQIISLKVASHTVYLKLWISFMDLLNLLNLIYANNPPRNA